MGQNDGKDTRTSSSESSWPSHRRERRLVKSHSDSHWSFFQRASKKLPAPKTSPVKSCSSPALVVRFARKQMSLDAPSVASHTLETPRGRGWQCDQSEQEGKLAQQEEEKKNPNPIWGNLPNKCSCQSRGIPTSLQRAASLAAAGRGGSDRAHTHTHTHTFLAVQDLTQSDINTINVACINPQCSAPHACMYVHTHTRMRIYTHIYIFMYRWTCQKVAVAWQWVDRHFNLLPLHTDFLHTRNQEVQPLSTQWRFNWWIFFFRSVCKKCPIVTVAPQRSTEVRVAGYWSPHVCLVLFSCANWNKCMRKWSCSLKHTTSS